MTRGRCNQAPACVCAIKSKSSILRKQNPNQKCMYIPPATPALGVLSITGARDPVRTAHSPEPWPAVRTPKDPGPVPQTYDHSISWQVRLWGCDEVKAVGMERCPCVPPGPDAAQVPWREQRPGRRSGLGWKVQRPAWSWREATSEKIKESFWGCSPEGTQPWEHILAFWPPQCK